MLHESSDVEIRTAPSVMDTIHAVLFPFPEQGHITPVFQLALHLASRGAYITFINTELGRLKLPARFEDLTQTMKFQFVCIADGLSPTQDPLSLEIVVSECSGPANAGSPAMPALFRSLESQSLSLQKILTELNGAQGWPPFSCFISDASLPWTAQVAHGLHIPWMIFSTASATRLWVTTKVLGYIDMDADLEKCDIDSLGSLSKNTCTSDLLGVQNSQRLELVRARVAAMRNADLILLNTCNELEEEALKGLSALSFRIIPLGPLCIGAELKDANADEEFLSWLDKQVARSVLYISFGSKLVLQGKLLEQLAFGIESSNVPFLWALRVGDEGLPEGFLQRTESRGRIMTWVPQKRVLQHGAIGAFFTHCGWNSVLEAVVEGVPMICWPVFLDQPTNRLLIEQKWKIGQGIQEPIVAEEVRGVIQDVMENHDFRRQASLLSLSVKSSLGQRGTSSQNFGFLTSKGWQSREAPS